MYIVALLAALPLYTGDGYGQLGVTKYVLFRNVSLLCLACWILLGTPGRVRILADWLKAAAGGRRPGRAGKTVAAQACFGNGSGVFSMVDCAVAAYGVCVALSAFFSHYRLLAWFGYDEWYMGAFSQLMFVGIYFFVSRQYDGSGWPLYLGEAALFLVSVLGLLHKLGIDPLGLQKGWNSGDWVYSHMLSTLGNINWLCGYYSVALALVMAHYLREERRSVLVPLYAAAVSSFLLLGVQGSQGGLLILGVCVALCLLFGWRQRAVRRKIYLLLAGFFLCMPFMGLLMDLRGEEAAVVADGDVFERTVWYGWLAAALVCGVLYVVSRKRDEARESAEPCMRRKGDGGAKRAEGKRWPGRMLALGCAGLLMAAFLVLVHRVDDGFGSGRGFLWRIALEGFAQADFKDKLLGAGPDCFAAAVFASLGAGADVWSGDHWDGAVFTNAHNEILNQLCNVGILGTLSYLSVFAAGLGRYRREYVGWLGLLVIGVYGVHALISFQQVLNAPLLFLALGLCESKMRNRQASA